MNELGYEYKKIDYNGQPKIYIDFLIDGVSLRELLNESKNIGILGWGIDKAYESVLIEEYLRNKKSTLKTGSCIVYGCAECGDINCGAITMQIEKEKNKVIWKNFAFETDYDEAEFEDFQDIKPIEFDLNEYQAVFETIKKELGIL